MVHKAINGIPESDAIVGGGLYVHVAYCRRKCIYCDFYSAGDRIADWHGYVDALCLEFQNRINELAWPLRTVYFGGGTPSLMPESEFIRLCGFLRPYMQEAVEFTMEVNPDDVDSHMLQVWKRGGVNRLSLGIQTFSDASLTAIGRRHDSKTAMRAYTLARRFFDNVSIDLMFGLPCQSLEAWHRDLLTALQLHPEHISAYSLMYEEGTPLTALRDTGRITEASEETSEEMFLLLIDVLRKAGYDHYEISNFALPGFRSFHNASYWLQRPYIGLGPSAHSYDGLDTRKCNPADIRGYLRHWSVTLEDGISEDHYEPVIERLSEIELMEEYVMTRMRTREGIPLDDFGKRFGPHAVASLMRRAKVHTDRELVLITESNISFTEKGVLLSDSVILDLSDFR